MTIQTNKYQTPVTDELLAQYPEEVREQLFDFINGVDFIKWLISPDRPYAKDCPHDEQGRVIVDLAHPHIIEDADYFRPAALHFMKHGCYTFLRPNSNPHSEYRKFWAEEMRRCYEGYVRESDGEWVTGLCYWFLNYNPMLVNKIVPGSKRAERVESFPFFFEGIYWRFHYLQQAKLAGQHAIELARRQCAKSYSLSSIMTHNLILGEADPNPETHRRRTTVLTAYEKEYLKDDKDGTFSKFKPALGFIFTHTPYPHLMLKNSPNEMSWQMGYKNELGVDAGSLNQVLGVSAKDNPDKLRGKRGWVLFEEMGSFKGLLALYDTTRKGVEDGNYAFATMYLVGCVCAGTKVWTLDGRYINIESLNKADGIVGFTPEIMLPSNDTCGLYLLRGATREPILSDINMGIKECVRITLNNGNTLCCSKDHPIFIQKQHSPRNSTRYYEEVFKFAGDLKVGDRVIEIREVPTFGNDTLFDARLVGMLIGDGTYGLHNSVKYCSEDKELLDYVKQYDWKSCVSHITKKGNTYEEGRIVGLVSQLREIGIYGQTKTNKRLPDNYQTLDSENTIKLLSGLYDTDGSMHLSKRDGYIYLTQSNREILEQVKILWRKFGVVGAITKTEPKISENRKDKNPWYTLTISGRYSATNAARTLQLLVPHKRDKLQKIINFYIEHPSKKEQNYPKDIIVSTVHSVEDLGEQPVYNLTAGLSHTYLANNIVTHNTAAEDESDFTSAKTLLYSPSGYNIYSIPNVFDKRGQGNKEFGFFFPSYINRSGCYNKDGVSDVVKALLEILLARYKAKYSADPQSVLRVIAEDPITPAEAIIKVKASYFPTAALNERLAQLDEDPKAFNDVYVGELILKDGEVAFTPTGDVPIHKYGEKNTTRGALEIFEMPEKNREGRVFNGRYIIGHDPVDNDQAESSSLSSTFVFDLFTDKIVAEYTGRQAFADDNFEIVRKLCLFYNAKCLYEAHAYSEVVHTPEGIKSWKDIKVGDSLFSPTKGVVKVIDIPVDTRMPIYKVTLSDGRVVTASDRHIWTVYQGTSKNLKNITTEELINMGLKNSYGQHKFFIPEGGGVEYTHKKLPIDPYTMGLILAEGSIRKNHCGKNFIQISSSEEDMKFYETEIPYKVKHIGTKGYSWHLFIDGCRDIMQSLNLYNTTSHNKFIPTKYLESDWVQRMNLLQGLMDGDGCACAKGASVFITVSKELAKNVLTLCRSLGIKAWESKAVNSYRVCIAATNKIFKLPRKVVEQHTYKPYTKGSKASALLFKTAIESIEFSHEELGKCVTVDSEDGLYYIGDYIVTHNSNKKGLFAYFSKNSCTHLLAETPEYLRDKQFIKYSNFGSNKYGVNASAAINDYANGLLRDWLLTPHTVVIKAPDGNLIEQSIPMLYTIRNRALLEELVSYTPELNVDRIRAMGMVMLYRQEKIILYRGDMSAAREEKYDSDYLGNDKFFTNNYDRRFLNNSKFSKN